MPSLVEHCLGKLRPQVDANVTQDTVFTQPPVVVTGSTWIATATALSYYGVHGNKQGAQQ